jgi:capsule biosynthesis phosphatase
MRIVIDLDGTISGLKKEGQDYSTVEVNPGAVEKIKNLKKQGHYIILFTARHMKTTKGNVGEVIKKVGNTTIEWLNKNDIPFDEILFGKPYGDVYVDDLGYEFKGWENVSANDFNEEHVNILIPMAGEGSRFAKAAYKEIKPLIKVKGKRMIEWAMESFDFLDRVKSYKLIFVIQELHDKEFALEKQLKDLYGSKCEVVKIPKLTRGQLETSLNAELLINNFNKLFIFNCDTFSKSKIWDLIESENPEGIISCFKNNDPKYSYAKLDKYGYVSETAEKKVISDNATTGLYYFKHGSVFVKNAKQMISQNKKQHNEFYIAPLYNDLIAQGKRIKIIEADTNWILGTPEELEIFEKSKLS